MDNLKIRWLETLRGTRGRHFLKDFERSQWWPRERLREHQNTSLRALVHHAFEHVPFYRELGRAQRLRPEDIRGRDDLRLLPIVDKATMSADPRAFTADNAARFRPRRNSTAGTTGTPFFYLLSRDAWSAGWGVTWRGWGWAGYRLGDRMALLAGSALFQGKAERGLKKLRDRVYYGYFQNLLPLSAFDLSEERLGNYLAVLRQARPPFLRGYAQALHALAEFARARGGSDLSFRAIFSTAEQLFPWQRTVIEEQFRCRVFDGYGCYDGNLNAMECDQHRGFHLAMETSIVEFVTNGSPVRAGEKGEILSTSLFNYSFPFIRYRVGDEGVPSDRPCPCGRGLDLMDRVEGRCNDFIVAEGGKRVHSEFFSHVFWETSWVSQFQVHQVKPEEVTIRIVRNREPRAEEVAKVRGIIGQRLGRIALGIEFVDRIDQTRAGKRRFIVSELAATRGKGEAAATPPERR